MTIGQVVADVGLVGCQQIHVHEIGGVAQRIEAGGGVLTHWQLQITGHCADSHPLGRAVFLALDFQYQRQFVGLAPVQNRAIDFGIPVVIKKIQINRICGVIGLRDETQNVFLIPIRIRCVEKALDQVFAPEPDRCVKPLGIPLDERVVLVVEPFYEFINLFYLMGEIGGDLVLQYLPANRPERTESQQPKEKSH